jgi:hypothetical protein
MKSVDNGKTKPAFGSPNCSSEGQILEALAIGSEQKMFTLHLAIFREPYLTSIMEGKKTIETRFAKRPCAPYQRISAGDIIVLKRASGGIVGICHFSGIRHAQFWICLEYRRSNRNLSLSHK